MTTREVTNARTSAGVVSRCSVCCALDIRSYNLNVCYAFPVVTPSTGDAERVVVLRGYNFWDTRDALLEYAPLDRSVAPSVVRLTGQGVIGHETTTAIPNCQVPDGRGNPGSTACLTGTDGGNLSHNTAIFPVPQEARGFLRLRMMNHNTDQGPGDPFVEGRFRHWNAAAEAGRVIHVCYPAGVDLSPVSTNLLGNLVALDTRRNCQLPGLTCSQNNDGQIGTCAAGIWSTVPGERPRPLSQCRHLAGTPPVCGETPEWLYSELRPFPGLGSVFPVVFASANQQKGFKLVQRLYGTRCIEETGWDWTGSDELRVETAGFRVDPSTREMVAFTQRWDDPEGFDSTGEQIVFPRLYDPPKLSSVVTPVGLNEPVSYSIALFERDCSDDILCRVAAVALGVVAAAALIYAITLVCPPCAAKLAALVGGVPGKFALAAVAAAYVLVLWEASADDPLAATILAGSAAEFGERYTVSHAPGFDEQMEGATPGPLPTQPGAGNRGITRNRLVRPNGPELAGSQQRLFNPAETDSGLVDGHKMIGFREGRELVQPDESNYFLQFLWQRIRCDGPDECDEVRVNADPTLPVFDPTLPQP